LERNHLQQTVGAPQIVPEGEDWRPTKEKNNPEGTKREGLEKKGGLK